jgi:hypothetical protein
MNDRDQRRYDRLTRVQTFGRENSAERAPQCEKKPATPGSTPTKPLAGEDGA